jgi:hypothetical protein
MVATRPFERFTAGNEPAISTCAMIQPPNTSPWMFASEGIGIIRNTGCLSTGRRVKDCCSILMITVTLKSVDSESTFLIGHAPTVADVRAALTDLTCTSYDVDLLIFIRI